MKKLIIGTILLLLGATGNQVTAHQTHTPGITKEQIKARKKINHGVRSGALTRKEYKRLQMQQSRINYHKQIAKADGVVTGRERKHIRKQQRRAGYNINRQLHDAQRR